MDYKEKYEQVLEKAKKMYNSAKGLGFNADCVNLEVLFPELKKSEGEEIRKALCKMVNETASDDLWTYYDIHKEEALAWLEKQGRQQKVSWSEEDEKNYQMLQKIICFSDTTTNLANKLSDWLKSLKGKCKGDVKDNKIKPKFKVGNWISGYYNNYKIKAINDEGYVVEDVNGNKVNILFENEKFHHLWTIEDAKDGDVLVHSSFMFDDFIFIYNNTSNLQAYCYYSNEKNRFIIEDRGHYCPWNMQEVTPVTKEQRDLLFTKMKEAGYNWNEKELKLEKI